MDEPNWVETSSTEQLPVVVAVEQATAVNLSDCETIEVGVTRQHYIQPPTLAHSNLPPAPKYNQVVFCKEKRTYCYEMMYFVIIITC